MALDAVCVGGRVAAPVLILARDARAMPRSGCDMGVRGGGGAPLAIPFAALAPIWLARECHGDPLSRLLSLIGVVILGLRASRRRRW